MRFVVTERMQKFALAAAAVGFGVIAVLATWDLWPFGEAAFDWRSLQPGTYGEWLAGVGTLFLGGVAVYQIKELRSSQSRSASQNRRDATLRYWMETSTMRNELRACLPYEYNTDACIEFADSFELNNLDEWQNLAQREEIHDESALSTIENHQRLRAYLSLIEPLGVGVEEDVFDLEVIHMLDGARLAEIEDAYGDYIRRLRASTGRSGIYRGVLSLARDLRQRQTLEPATTIDTGVDHFVAGGTEYPS